MTNATSTRLLYGILTTVPFASYVIRLLEAANFGELALFGANAAAALVLLVAIFGFPLFMIVMYCAVGLAALSILIATRGR